MRETSCSVSLLSLIAPLFSALSEQEYAEVRENPAWDVVRAASSQEAADPAERETLGCACALPYWPQRSLLQNEVLVSGMPLAAMPVESLYKPWSSDSGNAYGAQRGLYRGEPARRMQSVYASLDIEVPARFAAMPDHLTLELGLWRCFWMPAMRPQRPPWHPSISTGWTTTTPCSRAAPATLQVRRA